MGFAPPIVGMVGAGQLARMSVAPAVALGVRLRLLAATPGDSAAQVGAEVALGDAGDLDALMAFAEQCDVVTFDHELVPPAHLESLAAAGHVLRPGPGALRFAQDKAHQRAAFARNGLPVPPHQPVDSPAAVVEFGRMHGWPVVVKAVQGGYDGRGVWTATGPDRVEHIWAEARGSALLAEAYVALDKELAVVVARRPGGQTRVYPVVETVQRDGICTELIAPAGIPQPVRDEAAELGVRIADLLDVTGVLATELFWTGVELLVNEVATRPHNSGHWTIEGARTSQFANHLRAVLDWPLGSPALTAPAVVTVNVLGPADGDDPAPHLPRALSVADAAVHLYGKQPRAGRKLGHVTAWGSDVDETRRRAHEAAGMLTGGPR